MGSRKSERRKTRSWRRQLQADLLQEEQFLVSNRERKAPLWVRTELCRARRETRVIEGAVTRLQAAHVLLTECDWFVIPGPQFQGDERTRALFFLDRDGAHAACTLGPGDKLMVGRARKTYMTGRKENV